MDAFSSSTLALTSLKRSLFQAPSEARRFDAGMGGISSAVAALAFASNEGLARAWNLRSAAFEAPNVATNSALSLECLAAVFATCG